MLNAAHQRFAEAIVEGKNHTEAYAVAFPKNKNPGPNANRLMCDVNRDGSKNIKKHEIEAEIERLRRRAQEKAGGVVCTVASKRRRLYRIVEQSENEIAVISAIKADNEMDPEFVEKAQRVEVTVDEAKLAWSQRIKARKDA